LIGIDSPELDDSRESVRFLAHAAKRFCFTRLYRRRVRLIYDWEKRDRYGRLLAYLKIDEDIFNETILREGFAAVFLKFPFREDFRRRFERAALKARAEGRGLWSPVPYPVIGPGEAKSFLERLASVRFRCTGIRRKGNLTLLEAGEGAFAALIRKRDRNRFPDPERIRGREISVTGLIEDYRGQPQVMLSQPSQIEFLKSSELRR